MFDQLIHFSIKNRVLVFLLAAVITALGLRALSQLPIDAVPDVTNVQVQVLTSAPGLGPVEVERFITVPIETAMGGLPRTEELRSVSKFGLSVVTIAFEDGTDIYFARQLVSERLQEARENIPEGYGTPEMGPTASGLGEIYQFEVRGEGKSPMELREILEWQLIPRLRAVPGVVEVNSFGGELKTYEVQLDPARMTAYGLPLQQVFEALERNNANAGGAYIARGPEQVLIRGEGLVETLEDIGHIVVATSSKGIPVYVRDIAEVKYAPLVRQGAVTRDGRGEAVTGIVMMRIGENSRTVVNHVKEAVERIRPTLPPGVTIDTFYDRTELVRKTLQTVSTNLLEGGLLVIVVLFLMLRNLRAGLLVASIIPLCMLAAFIGMRELGISGNLMSLGAIDFGLIVDGALIIVENAVRHIAEENHRLGRALTPSERDEVVYRSAVEIRGAAAFGEVIIGIVYLPVLALSGIEGKMFAPMAITVLCALAAAFVFSLTLVPALASVVLPLRATEKESIIVSGARKLYEPALRTCMAHRKAVVGGALGVLVASLALVPFLGAEFMPRLDEGAVALQAWRVPSVSLEESLRQTTLIEKVLQRFPEVRTVVSKTGRAEIATDPMGVEISDIFVMLKPSEEWTTGQDRDALIAAFDAALKQEVPGSLFSYSQPIELRVSELISGVRSDVALKLYGEDLEVLKRTGDKLAAVLARVPGAADVKAEQIAGLPVARVRVDRQAISRYGINARDVLDAIETLGGKQVGTVLEGQKRFALQVRFAPGARQHVEQLGNIQVTSPTGQLVPLSQIARIEVDEGPAQVSRENLQRRLTIEANVRGRDMRGFVSDAQAAIAREVPLPPGYWLDWGGQFENLQTASSRLAVVVPFTLLLIFLLLYLTFQAARPALLIYLNIPFAVTGGVLALGVRGMPLSISAAVGFIALFGVAVLNGLVLVSAILRLRQEGQSPEKAAHDAAHLRLRPVLTTALVASLGFIPMALSTGAGAEVQKPLATVVIGGLLSSTLLTLLVLPTVYAWFDKGLPVPQNPRNASAPRVEAASARF
ncbi:efflux RND transporter permease subunit [Stigmatella aurantiaca]|uniref:Heavy metal efflux pump, CzcA family n=1 Tax=Stigmatella aurantiaca (strain DW4/3-1) TaxID=378806 RepID=Q093I2_STIAD|nr:CusA/CzcA family heavy metal efflux RND transporter [Stigmatella aurantiaca]ADO75966.1 Heavy metal efflux pump, CzcA family [Stigmatella aurantiaca DW4/3-1]EAU66873.1 heavy metal efflux pump, CzcA family [Stigmatella aurantiaca DW4/3-1]